MADSTSTIQIDIVADAQKFREELKNAASDVNKFDKKADDLKKSGFKQDRTIQRATKDFQKFNKKFGTEALDREKKMRKELNTRLADMRKLHRQGKQETEEFKKQKDAVEKLADAYVEVKKNRQQIIGLTKKEKALQAVQKVGGEDRTLAGTAFGMAKGAGMLAVGAVVGAVTKRVFDAIEARAQYEEAGMGVAGAEDANMAVMDAASLAGTKRGYTPLETMQQAAMIARQTGQATDVTKAQSLARAGMLDFGQAAGAYGLMTRGGVTDKAADKSLERTMSSAFFSGMKRARFGEYLDVVSSLVERAQATTPGQVSTGDYAGIMGVLGKLGGAGMQGQRGAAMIGKLENAMANPNSEAAKAFFLRSQGFGTPGGTTDYVTALKNLEYGVRGEQGAKNIKGILRQLGVEYGGTKSDAAKIAFSKMTGTGIQQSEAFLNALGTQDLDKAIADFQKSTETIDQQMLDVLKGDLAKRTQFVADRAQDLVTQGKDLLPSAESIQKDINKLIAELMPYANSLLKLIADGVHDVSTLLMDVFGDEASPGLAERSMATKLDTALKGYQAGTADRNTFLGSLGEARGMYASLISERNMKSAQLAMTSTTSSDYATRSQELKALNDRIAVLDKALQDVSGASGLAKMASPAQIADEIYRRGHMSIKPDSIFTGAVAAATQQGVVAGFKQASVGTEFTPVRSKTPQGN